MTIIACVLDFIDQLYSLEIPMAIASSSPGRDIEKIIESFNFSDKITYYVSGDEVEYSKAALDISLKAAKELNVKFENYFVSEDSSNSVKVGHTA